MNSFRLCIPLLALSGTVLGQAASVAFEDSYAVYGPGIYPAVTHVQHCAPYRLLVAYINGTDMLFVDALELANNESTYRVLRGVSVREFNVYEQSAKIERVTCRLGDRNTLQVSGVAHSLHSDRDFEFSITFEAGLESYEFEGND